MIKDQFQPDGLTMIAALAIGLWIAFFGAISLIWVGEFIAETLW